MSNGQNSLQTLSDGTVNFLPHRLNRQPVVVRGLTADELWITVGITGIGGLLAGIPLGIVTSQIGMVPTSILICIALGIFVGGSILRRQKRGRPDTWLYRQLQWQIRVRYPMISDMLGGSHLITRSGRWTTRRILKRKENGQ
ncbi:TIGR03750 family conjugal transfer protein [Saezia sanguinis]|uniref:TIGR03750 family conjugal transfer protein n=1 Tax=Saezia sanguinis TaxID=1965230 RepID=UPI00304F3090